MGILKEEQKKTVHFEVGSTLIIGEGGRRTYIPSKKYQEFVEQYRTKKVYPKQKSPTSMKHLKMSCARFCFALLKHARSLKNQDSTNPKGQEMTKQSTL